MEQTLILNLKRKETLFVLISMVITLVVTLLSAYFKTGYWSAFALATGMYGVLGLFAYTQKDMFLKQLLLFGIIAGTVELLADCWLVETAQNLVYPANEPKLLCSPNYMPFAWAVVLVQVGYLGYLISSKVKMFEAMLLSMLIGMVFIPVFEQCAFWAEWWYYKPCKMLLNTPWYIIMAEGIICFFLPAIFFVETQKRIIATVLFGLAQGLLIFIAYYISYKLIE
ncbi:MAG: hypothetical protein FGM54_04135 [Chitinophagaceae bacterium]|nr:hypothetical protein [Chitinophagaceae bacterium]